MGKLFAIALTLTLAMAPTTGITPALATPTDATTHAASNKSNPSGNTASVGKQAKKATKPPAVRTAITQHPTSAKVHEKSSATFKAQAKGSNLHYTWQKQHAGKGSWKNVASTSSLTLNNVSHSENNTAVRVVVAGSNGSATSKTAKLTVVKAIPATMITTHPRSATVTEGSKATFSVNAQGQSLKYEWQIQAPRSSWKKLSTGSSASFKTSYAQNNSSIRVIVTGANGKATSSSAKLTVKKAVPATRITAHPKSVSVRQGSPASFSTTATGQSLRYKWQIQAGGKGSWSTLGTQQTVKIASATAKQNKSKVRVIVTGANGSATSSAATLTVTAVPTTEITKHPASATVVEGQNHTFTTAATGANLYYEWQIKYPGDSSWYYFARGANPQGVLTNISITETNAQIRVLAMGDKGYAYSKSAKLTVKRAAKPVISKATPQRTDYSKSATVTITGKDFQDVTQVQYSGGVAKNLAYSKSKSSIKVTIPAEQAPTTATLVVKSASSTSKVTLTRSEVLSNIQRSNYLSNYETQKKLYGTPTGKVGEAVASALKTIKSNPAWASEAHDASKIMDSGFTYRRYETASKDCTKELDKVNKEITKETRSNSKKSKLNELLKQREYLNSEIARCNREMNTQLGVMRSLGAKV